jgi:hypothetical protein
VEKRGIQMITLRQLFELTQGLSAMAETHPNDIISNALAALSDRLTRLGPQLKPSMLTYAEKCTLAYYHAHK